MTTLDATLDDVLDAVEAECFDAAIRPAENPRDLLTFARSLYLPPVREGDPPEVYNPDGHQAQLLALREFESPRWRKFVIVACTQDGKSWIVQIVIFYFACEMREAVVVGGPDMRIAQDNWRQKTRPAMVASGLKGFLPISGPGSAGGSDVDTISLNGGGLVILLGAGGKNASGQAGRTSRTVVVDEFGKVKKLLSGKFDRRADSFGDEGRIWKSGTVEADHEDTLLEAYDLSSKGRYVWRCHHCKQHTRLDWEQVTADYTTEFTAANSVRIACARCGTNWTDEERKANLRDGHLVHHGQEVDADGKITGPEPETFTCGILWSALDSPRRKLSILAVEFRNASIQFDRGNAQPLIDFYHDQLARRAPVDDGREELDTTKLAERSAGSAYIIVRLRNLDGTEANQWQVATAPDGVEFITVAIDQSLRRLWYVIRGHGEHGRTWVLGWGRIPICGDLETPTRPQRHQALDKIRALTHVGIAPATGSEPFRPALGSVDVSDYHTDTVEWLNKNHDFVAIRGTGDRQFQGMTATTGAEEFTEPGWYTMRSYEAETGHQEILWIHSDPVKTELSRALAKPQDGAGAALIPRGLDPQNTFLQHLTSEHYVKAPGGRFTWTKKSRFNDWWDCCYYTQALGKLVVDRYPSRVRQKNPPPKGGNGGGRGDDFNSHMGAW